MNFLRRNLKKLLLFIILTALAGSLFNRFMISKVPVEQQMGTIDLGPHPSDVMIRFSREYKGLKFQDALNLTQQEYDSLTREEIIKMEGERFRKWINSIEHPNAK